MISSRKISNEILAVMIAATLLASVINTMSSNVQSVFAQQPPPQPQPAQPQPQLQQQQPQQQQQQAPLNFYLKLANNASTAQAASQAAANGTGTKNMTITVNVQKGPGGQQIPLPISALVPSNIQPQDLQLCASLATGSESCQPLSGGQQGASIDLTQPAAGGATAPPMGTTSPMPPPSPSPAPAQPRIPMSPTPAPAPQSYPNNGGAILENAINPVVETITSLFTMQHADAQLISVEDTTVNIPITVIVPIDLNIQNAQICASVASSGDQSCTQVVLNPEQTSYTDVDVDLSSATPTLTTAEQESTTAALSTTAPTTEPAPTTTTETAPTTSTSEPAPTEESTTDTGTGEGETTAEEPTTEPSTEGSTSEGGTE
jgi:hypothetical protein